MADLIKATLDGSMRVLAMWPDTPCSAPALQRATRAASIVESFDTTFARARDAIEADKRLTVEAKWSDKQAAARNAASEAVRALTISSKVLRTEVETVLEARAGHLAVAPYRDGDMATVMVDLALAAKLQGMASGASPGLALAGDRRMLEAAARLPEALTGIPRSTVESALVESLRARDPAAADAIEGDMQALAAAKQAHARAFELLAASAGLDRLERRQLGSELYAELGLQPDTPPAPPSAPAERGKEDEAVGLETDVEDSAHE